VLILPPGHAQAVGARRPLSVREKRMIGGVVATVAAVIVALVISLSSSSPTSGHGCIYLTLAANAMTGGEEIYQCGAQARSTCATAQAPGAFTADAAHEVAAACRRAGLPVGR
jgi:uncharacterized oligopeptide transporter (OPT) family protein